MGGLALALTGALVPRTPASIRASEAIAFVNEVPIPRATLAAVLARSGASAESTRRAAIENLVNEELLVQRAVEIGLLDSDRSVRKALARAAIDMAVTENDAIGPTEAELRAFHASHAALFSLPRRARVRALFFSDEHGGDEALRQAREAAAAIAAGMPFDEASKRFGDHPGLPLADALLPEAVLRRDLGPALAEAALALSPGDVSEPVRAGAGVYLLQLAADEPARAATFDEVRARVEAALRRQRGDEAFASRLSGLRSHARIVRAVDAPTVRADDAPTP
jgi:hypothetical protein